MEREFQTASEVLDQALRLFHRVAAPWAGVLALFTLPSRFVTLYLLRRLAEFGSKSHEYGTYLRELGLILLVTHLVAATGRFLYAQACRSGLERNEVSFRSLGRIPFSAFLSYLLLYVSILATELLCAPVLVLLPFFVTFHALAAAVSGQLSGKTFSEPFSACYRLLNPQRIVVAVTAMFTVLCGCMIGALFMGYELLLSALRMLSRIDISILEHMSGHKSFFVLLVVFVLALVEPVWIAAMVCHMRMHQLHESGDDLKLTLEQLREARA